MVASLVALAGLSAAAFHIGDHTAETASTVHASYLAAGLLVGSLVASGLYWYFATSGD